MADDKDYKECEHVTCSCPAAEGSDYCSPYCEGSGDTTEVTCNCGHGGCAGETH